MSSEEMQQQYSIEYKIAALERVKKNTGFDVVEHAKEKQEKEMNKQKRRVPLFKPKQWEIPNLPEPKFKEPPIPDPRTISSLNSNLPHQPSDLCEGVLVGQLSDKDLENQSVTSITADIILKDDEKFTMCKSCESILRTHFLANLVKCANCGEVFPALSLDNEIQCGFTNSFSGS